MEHHRVILVDKHHHAPAHLLVCSKDDVFKTDTTVVYLWRETVFPFILRQCTVDLLLQPINGILRTFAEVKANDRMLLPSPVAPGNEQLRLLDAILCSKRLEQFAAPLEYSLKRRDEQRLAKPARTVQEIRDTLCYHLVDKLGLIDIHISVFTELLEALDAYRIFTLYCHGSPYYIYTAGKDTKKKGNKQGKD